MLTYIVFFRNFGIFVFMNIFYSVRPHRTAQARKLSRWPKICTLAHAFLLEYSDKRLALGNHRRSPRGDLTWASADAGPAIPQVFYAFAYLMAILMLVGPIQVSYITLDESRRRQHDSL